MKDPYETLGVDRTASEAAIRSAYRKLAKRHHPDLNPGKPEAADAFKDIANAYALLSDADKRARFDRGEIDASGAEVAPERPFYRDFNDAARHARYGAGPEFDPDDLESLFGHAFRDQFSRGSAMRGADAHYTLTVDFLDAANGAVRRLTLPDGRTLDVTIPAGHRDGQVLRLKGQGMPGIGGGPPGDALIAVAVRPHKLFRRDGNDIVLELPVTLQEAVLGAKVEVPTIKGPVSLRIPAKSTTGKRLMLRGRGIVGGHQYVDLKVMTPTQDEPELAAFLEGWKPRHRFNPRGGLP
ncbi:J domain-containing protein [Limobrevibacterium gyesilva]|uniref:J domain-containing protein n=1 Tax=Limobrevibacterium gyesilva TaxID=2991712 RepID=A0AA42CHJ3_9PROT|nr:J domain-containing protein [Limobrevibacterium gyesilva]MCW3477316.1 J domain-containing protein [Limobrevibacterium gyesilva]